MTNVTTKPPVDPLADAFDLQREVGWLVYDASRLLMRSIEREVRKAGITPQQWRVLVQLAREDGQTQSELAEETEIAPAPLGRLLDRLEAKQLVRRVRSVDDRRVVNLELTEAGQVAAREIPVVLSRVQNAHLAGFSADEWQTLKGYLRRILETAQTLQAQQAQHTVNTAAARVADITPAKTSLPT